MKKILTVLILSMMTITAMSAQESTKKTALVMIDIQNDYFERGKWELVGAKEAAKQAQMILKQFRDKDLPIIHVQHVSMRPDAIFFLPDTEGVEIHQSVTPVANEKVIVKHSPNSFINTTLFESLQAESITHLVICGMMTNMCVDATTRAAKDLGFECTVISDACATRNLEIDGEIVRAKDVHNSFLASFSFYYAEVCKATDFKF